MSKRQPDNPPSSQSTSTASTRKAGDVGSAASRLAESRMAKKDSISRRSGSMLRLTRRQRDLLRSGLADLRYLFTDKALWTRASEEAAQVEHDLEIPHFATGFNMWTSSVAAMALGSWWVLMPGCGAPAMQDSLCKSLSSPFLLRRTVYVSLQEAIKAGQYPAMREILERTERIRCMLVLHVRDSDQKR